ncbi:MAG: FkbM family methyltransferase [Candidatus Sigynarchaeota archaeon]
MKLKTMNLPNHRGMFVVDKMTPADIYKEIYEENVYLRAGLDVEPGNVVVDIGGNVGLFSMFILEKVPRIRLVAIEPVPLIFEALQANLQKFQPPQATVTLLNIGLAEKEKTAELQFYPRVPSDSTATPFDFDFQVKAFAAKHGTGIGRVIPARARAWVAAKMLRFFYSPVPVTCKMKTFSQVIADLQLGRIDLVKIDAENAEREVLAGIADEDWEKIQQLSIEVHTNIPGGQNLVAELTGLLGSKGFAVVVDLHSRFSHVGVHMMYAKKIKK